MSATRSTAIGAVADGSTPVAAGVTNDGSGACIGYQPLAADTAGTTTTENAAVCSAVPVNDGRLIKVTVQGTLQATGPTDWQILIFRDSTELIRADGSVYKGGANSRFHVVAFDHAPSAGNHSYTLAYGITGSSGETIIMRGDPDNPAIFVDDDGPDF